MTTGIIAINKLLKIESFINLIVVSEKTIKKNLKKNNYSKFIVIYFSFEFKIKMKRLTLNKANILG